MRNNFLYKESRQHGNILYPFEMLKFVQGIPNISIKTHWHDETEIIYVTEGEISANINDLTYNCRMGDILIINKGEIHNITGMDGAVSYYAFMFDASALSFSAADTVQKKYLDPINRDELIFRNKIGKDESFNKELTDIIMQIALVNMDHTPAYMLITKGLLLQLFGILFAGKLYYEKKSNSSSEHKYILLKQIVQYIDEHFSEPIHLNDISARFNITPKHFCKFFKNNFHKTLTEYIIDMRVEYALNLLSDTDDSVTDIAFKCGFSNMSYFTRTFKHKTGYTPSQFKKLLP